MYTGQVLTQELLDLEEALPKEAKEFNRTREIKDRVKYILMKPARDKILIETGHSINQ